MPITHKTDDPTLRPGKLATLPIILKALMRSFRSFAAVPAGPVADFFISRIIIGLGVVGSLVRQEPNNSVYLASYY